MYEKKTLLQKLSYTFLWMVRLWVIFFLHFSIILYSAFYEHQFLLKSEENRPNMATCHTLHVLDLVTSSPTPALTHHYHSLTCWFLQPNQKLSEDRANLTCCYIQGT